MKDFKQNTKMACEGSHYQAGGSVGSKIKDYVIDKEASNIAWNSPSPLHNSAENIKRYKSEIEPGLIDKLSKKANEAQDEAQRESTRGISPENRKKRGGSVKRKK